MASSCCPWKTYSIDGLTADSLLTGRAGFTARLFSERSCSGSRQMMSGFDGSDDSECNEALILVVDAVRHGSFGMSTSGCIILYIMVSLASSEALPWVLWNRETRSFISKEQGNKGLKMREIGKIFYLKA